MIKLTIAFLETLGHNILDFVVKILKAREYDNERSEESYSNEITKSRTLGEE